MSTKIGEHFSSHLIQSKRLSIEKSLCQLPCKSLTGPWVSKTGRPYLYGTTFEFLERFGLTSLADLPPLEAEVAGFLVAQDRTAEGGDPAAAADG